MQVCRECRRQVAKPRLVPDFPELCDLCALSGMVRYWNLYALECRVRCNYRVETVEVAPVVADIYGRLLVNPALTPAEALQHAVRQHQPSLFSLARY